LPLTCTTASTTQKCVLETTLLEQLHLVALFVDSVRQPTGADEFWCHDLINTNTTPGHTLDVTRGLHIIACWVVTLYVGSS
jgi:hypothetical protein